MYNYTELNLFKCKAKLTSYLVGILCVDISKLFIIKYEHFEEIEMQDNIDFLNISNITIFSNDTFIDIDSNENNLVVSSLKYYYLFSFDEAKKYKKFRFLFNLSDHLILTQTKLFKNYIVSIIKALCYPYLKYINVIKFYYEEPGDLQYQVMDTLYQFNSELQFEYYRFQVHYCNSLLLINRLNDSMCIFISNYEESTIKPKGEIYIFQLKERDSIKMFISVVDKIELPLYSCGVKFIFLDTIIFFSCPNYNHFDLIQPREDYEENEGEDEEDNQKGKGHLYFCHRSSMCKETFASILIETFINSKDALLLGSSFDIIDINYNSKFLLVSNIYNGYIYLTNIITSQFNIIVKLNNVIDITNINEIYYDNYLFEKETSNSLIELIALYNHKTNKLTLWLSGVDLYYDTYYGLSINNLISLIICPLDTYYDGNSSCIQCSSNNYISEGFQSKTCNINCLQTLQSLENFESYYCPHFCRNTSLFGPNCLSCESYISQMKSENILPNELLIASYSNNAICEFYCIDNYAKLNNDCVEEKEYSKNRSIFSNNSLSNLNDDPCLNYTSCFDCYKAFCTWCDNINKCYSSHLADGCKLLNSYTLLGKYPFLISQFFCITNISSSEIILDDIEETNLTFPDNFSDSSEFYFYKIISLSYTSLKKISIHINIYQPTKFYEVVFYNPITKSYGLLEKREDASIDDSIDFSISTLQLYILISIQNSDKEVLSIKISRQGNYFTVWKILGIFLVSFITFIFVIMIMFYCKKYKSIKLSEESEQEKVNKKEKATLNNNNNSNSEIVNIAMYANSNSCANLLKKISLSQKKNEINLYFKNHFNNNVNKINHFLNEQLSKLITFYAKDKSNQNFTLYICSICKKKFSPKSKISIQPCNHFFHFGCLESQLLYNKHYFCPLCEYPIINIK